MEQFLGSAPTTLIGWVGTLLIIVGSFSFYWRQRRNEDLKILRETNRDQGDRIALLEKSVKDQDNSITILKGQVIALETKNKTLEDLVAIALKSYFFEHPEIATAMTEKVLK